MASHLYMQSDELEGLWPLDDNGKLDPEKKKLIKILEFQHGMDLPTSPVRPSFSDEGFRQGYVEHSPIAVKRQLDACSPYLMRAMVKRSVLKNVQIVSCEVLERVDKDKKRFPTPIWVIRLGHVVISSFTYGPVGTIGHAESINLHYRSINWAFRSIKLEDRQPGGEHTAGWNGKKNMPEDMVTEDDMKIDFTALEKLFIPV